MKARAERINHGLCHGACEFLEGWLCYSTPPQPLLVSLRGIKVLTCDWFIPVVQFEKKTGGSLSIGG